MDSFDVTSAYTGRNDRRVRRVFVVLLKQNKKDNHVISCFQMFSAEQQFRFILLLPLLCRIGDALPQSKVGLIAKELIKLVFSL